MTGTGKRRSLLAGGVALAAALAFMPGCGENTGNKNAGRVDAVERGWTQGQVRNKIGQPIRRIDGEWLELGNEEWVYPTGSVIFRRMMVTEVRHRRPGDPLPQAPRDMIDYTRHPGMEDDEYYTLRDQENKRRAAVYEGVRNPFTPGRSRADIERERQLRDGAPQARDSYRSLADGDDYDYYNASGSDSGRRSGGTDSYGTSSGNRYYR